MHSEAMVLKIVTHGRHVQQLAANRGWGCGARYTNLRDIREQHAIAMIDINWKRYSYQHHVAALQKVRPFMTVVRDIEDETQYENALSAADEFFNWVEYVILVPKFVNWSRKHERGLTNRHIVGFSVPTRYGSTALNIGKIGHQIHLLGGRPDKQRQLAAGANIVSIDCNRFTLDATFGDYFNGSKYIYSRKLDYENCLIESMSGIDQAWSDYIPSRDARLLRRRWSEFSEIEPRLHQKYCLP
jgi:hypothetical protein